jgi:hypothetical protein
MKSGKAFIRALILALVAPVVWALVSGMFGTFGSSWGLLIFGIVYLLLGVLFGIWKLRPMVVLLGATYFGLFVGILVDVMFFDPDRNLWTMEIVIYSAIATPFVVIGYLAGKKFVLDDAT